MPAGRDADSVSAPPVARAGDTGRDPYDWITDGIRWINKPDSYDDLDQMLEDAAASYRRNLWRNQAAEVHIYSEKDAISSVVLPVTRRWDVPPRSFATNTTSTPYRGVRTAPASCRRRCSRSSTC